MIVYDLRCDNGHRFEGWFGSSTDFAEQNQHGLVSCPDCGSAQVSKAPMSPAVPAKSNANVVEHVERQPVSNRKLPPEVTSALEQLAKAQAKALEKSKWVGDSFAETSRSMHYGERDQEPVHGQASVEEARDLLDEGIAVTPLPFPIAPPDELN